MSTARRCIAILAGSCALALGAGCGDRGNTDADAEDIKAVVARVFSTPDAARCAEGFTRGFLARVHDSIERCRRALAPPRAGEFYDPDPRANATTVDVDGDRASARVEVGGGPYVSTRGQVGFAREDGDWKISDLSVGFLRSQLRSTLSFSSLGDETTSFVELTCIGDGLDALDDALFKRIVSRALAGAAPDRRFVEVFTTCTGNPDQFIPGVALRPGQHALGGRLTITPAVARPGEVLRLGVLNLGDRTITYGLAVRVGRLVDGRWRDATNAIFGTSQPGFTRQAINVAPGGWRRDRADRIRLPATVQPGTYRVLKRIGRAAGAPEAHATLGETFVVR